MGKNYGTILGKLQSYYNKESDRRSLLPVTVLPVSIIGGAWSYGDKGLDYIPENHLEATDSYGTLSQQYELMKNSLKHTEDKLNKVTKILDQFNILLDIDSSLYTNKV